MKEGESMAETTEKLENGQGAGKIVEDVRKIEPPPVRSQTSVPVRRLHGFSPSAIPIDLDFLTTWSRIHREKSYLRLRTHR